MLYGIENMLDLKYLPLIKRGVKTHYEGSIDKLGGNADWDWWLYQDESLNNEWVLFDYEGAGCIYNFVQHRYPVSDEPTFRFYFDGETKPRFVIKHSQFGEVYPFVEPLASRYIGPVANGRGPIRVVRSYVPMPFAKSCKITSDIKLEGFDKALGHGGWGHVIYHAYSEIEADEIKTFSKDANYDELIMMWKNVGNNVIKFDEEKNKISSLFTIKKGESKIIFDENIGGLISGIKFKTHDFDVNDLSSLKIIAEWDDNNCDVDATFGCFFNNELGYNKVNYLLVGMDTTGSYYNYFPMPYKKSAYIEIKNNGDRKVTFDYASVIYTNEFNYIYDKNDFGYFRTSEYYARKHTEGADSIIAKIIGHGHVVGSIITGFPERPELYASCEGDVRIHFDGIRTPQIESDGSESYSCYGWGFPTPPEFNPASGYDGYNHLNWSMTRLCIGDWYPFLSDVHFAIESGANNDDYLEHSGMVFYYGKDDIKSVLTAEIIMGNEKSENENGYISFDNAEIVELESYFEGDDDHIAIKSNGRYTNEGCTFKINISDDTDYLIIRRQSDQLKGKQRAVVYVNDKEITEYPWYFADRNECKRWLEDDFVIPSKYIDSSQITVKIKAISNWNEFGYKIYTVKK